MKKKLSYRDKLVELAYIYDVKEIKDYEITDRFTEELESLIKEDPKYYLWTHNRFKRMRTKIA